MGFIFRIINLLLDVYKLLVVVHFVLTLVKVPANQWTTLLDSIVEPVLAPIRRLLTAKLPKNWQIIDWSPIALVIVITIIQWIL
ncbi:MAG: YggT family protein [Clostridiales bacterium]|nr:YggT family protein [Clostridiales bacterium]